MNDKIAHRKALWYIIYNNLFIDIPIISGDILVVNIADDVVIIFVVVVVVDVVVESLCSRLFVTARCSQLI